METAQVPSLDVLLHGHLVCCTQAASQFIGEPFVAFFAHGLLIVFVEFGFLCHFCIAHRAGKVMHTPGLVQSSKYYREKRNMSSAILK